MRSATPRSFELARESDDNAEPHGVDEGRAGEVERAPTLCRCPRGATPSNREPRGASLNLTTFVCKAHQPKGGPPLLAARAREGPKNVSAPRSALPPAFGPASGLCWKRP